MKRVLGLMLIIIVPLPLFAEVFRGIGPFDTFGDLKKKFPGATFERLTAAWLQENDTMYQITGEGMSGTIVVLFNDSRVFWKRLWATKPDSMDAFQKKVFEFSTPPYIRKEIEKSDDEALGISWVRWVPPSPIPLSRLIAKYGQPEKSDFCDDDFRPYKSWTTRGITATLSDDGKNVIIFDYEFTRAELQKFFQARYLPPKKAKPDAKPPK